MIHASLPAPIRGNDEQISAALALSDQSDSRLAEALWENFQRGYYRVFGYRSLAEYMKNRFIGTDMSGIAEIKARSIQRLIREYRVAREIPLFRANFDAIGRSNRRLIAQILTPENAETWITAALQLTARELEQRIRDLPPDAAEQAQRRQRLSMSIYPETRAVWERAKAAARLAIEAEGGDPGQLTDALCLEFVCNEFLATYEPVGTLIQPGPGDDGGPSNGISDDESAPADAEESATAAGMRA